MPDKKFADVQVESYIGLPGEDDERTLRKEVFLIQNARSKAASWENITSKLKVWSSDSAKFTPTSNLKSTVLTVNDGDGFYITYRGNNSGAGRATLRRS